MLRAANGVLLCVLAVVGCPAAGPTPAPAPAKTAKSDPPKNAKAKAEAGPKATPSTKPPGKPDTKSAPADGPLGKTLADAPIPWETLIGSDPKTAEGFVGEPAAKGGSKESCVRFVPDRTWFKCKNVWQRYDDTTGTAKFVHMTYEDGKTVSVAFEELNGEGPFDPVKALRSVGLELPGPPKLEQPEDNVKVWSYWNSAARLRIGGRQYRVEVSLVDDKWDTSKVSVILNDPLSDDEKSRVFEVKPQRGADAAGG